MASTEGRDWSLSKDWRGEDVCGVTMEGIEGMDMVGTGVDFGCSATRGVGGGEVAGGETMGAGASTAGCGVCEGSPALLPSDLVASSSFTVVASSLDGTTSVTGSGAFESMLALGDAVTAFTAGLAGLDPRSDEVLASDPLFTALARRSWRRELGRLRDELREASMLLALRRAMVPCL